MMNLQGLQKLTLLDYPGHMACTVFTGGCNFRCPYCHNSGLVQNPNPNGELTEEEFFEFLASRKGKLEGVCVTGGEPTLQPDLPKFLAKIQALGFLVKLDTNGQNPDLLKKLLDAHLVDYVAMDVKNSLERYGETVGIPSISTNNVAQSIRHLLAWNGNYEFRTTVTAEYHDDASMLAMAELLAGARHYYLQAYRDSEQVLLPGSCHTPDEKTMLRYKELIAPIVKSVAIRGQG